MKKHVTLLTGISLGFLFLIAGCGVQSNTKPVSQQSPAQTMESKAAFWTPGHRSGNGNQLFDFIDAQHGWKLVILGSSAGSEGVDLFATTDGGKEWNKVASADMSNPGGGSGPAPENPSPGTIPFVGDKNGITFLSASTGWITGTTGAGGVDWLYVTRNGGHTWQHQELGIPPGFGSSQLSITPPAFFTPEDGILPVAFNSYDKSDYYLYFTDNGGKTWGNPEPLIGYHAFGPWQWLFNTYKNGFVTINWSTWQTDDGGYTWTVYSRSGRAGIAVSPQASAVGSTVTITGHITPTKGQVQALVEFIFQGTAKDLHRNKADHPVPPNQLGQSLWFFPVDSSGDFKGTVVIPAIVGAGNGVEAYEIVPGTYKFALNYASKLFVFAKFQVTRN